MGDIDQIVHKVLEGAWLSQSAHVIRVDEQDILVMLCSE